ncbi:hypothetical protein [Mycolicibacterium llatzerense]|uniref:hypothetical protein n=1 Tax=Mycolicibacterium llatzerense TaxID=280871 RepID=UPI0008DD9556|nr:hypothetical protein [Mycolicibacterium llatzerense]
MFRNEISPATADTLRAIRDAVVADDDARAEELAKPFAGTDSVEHVVVSAMDRVRYERGTYRRFTGGLIRWLRRATREDQTWALARIGLEWWPKLSLESRQRNPDDVTDEPAIEQEEATRCLTIAAARGHRRAALWHGTLESLITAYADGTPDHEITAEELRSVEARIARHLAEVGDADAAFWFRRAVASPRWEDEDGDETWLSAMSGYALWVHGCGDVELCEQISTRVIDDAVLEGGSDRCAIVADAHKPYRNSYQLAAGNEAVRMSTMTHVLTDHDLSPTIALDLLRLASRNHCFQVESRPMAAAAWDRRYGPIRDAPAVESLAWAMIGWLVADVVPTVLRLLDCAEHADRVQAESATVDFSANGFWEPTADNHEHITALAERYWGWGEPLDAVEEAEFRAHTEYHDHPFDTFIEEQVAPERVRGWGAVKERLSQVDARIRRDTRRWRNLVQAVGLGPTASSFEVGLRPYVSEDRDRLLGGSDAWLAMWLSTTTPTPEGWRRSVSWCAAWDKISPMVDDYLDAGAILARGQSDLASVQAAISDGVQRHVEGVLAAAFGTPDIPEVIG